MEKSAENYKAEYKNITIKTTDGSTIYGKINIGKKERISDSFALIVVTIIRSNCWWHPMKIFFLLCRLPFRKADDITSPALSRPCGRRLQLPP
jgi:hypothetical protein